MHLRRSLALSAGALVLLTSCGFDLATDQPYTPGEGTNDDSGDVQVLSALVVAGQPDAGTVVVTLVNTTDEEQALTSISGEGLTVEEFEPVTVAPRDHVNLATEGGVPVTGTFEAGDYLPLTYNFDNGTSTTFDAVVVTACGPYEGLDLTEDAEGTPYDCEAEPEPVHGEGH